MLLHFLGKCPEEESLDHKVVILLIVKETSIVFSVVAAPIYIPYTRNL